MIGRLPIRSKNTMITRSSFTALSFSMLIMALVPHWSRADLVVVNFSGEVGIILGGAPVSAVFTTGDTFSGSLTYENTTPDAQAPNTLLGQYGLGMQEFSISFFPAGGGPAYYSSSQTTGFFSNNLEVTNGLSFDSMIFAANGLTNPPGLIAQRLQLNFKDDDGVNNTTTFSDDSLPAAPPFANLSSRNGTWNLGILRSIALKNISANVVPSGTPYANWITGFGLDPSDLGFDLDPDHDNLKNGVEAFFGTNPNEFNKGVHQESTDGTTTVLKHPQLDPSLVDVMGSYQWSLNLEDWYASDGVDGPSGGPTVTIPSVTPTGGISTITATSSGPLEQLFFRVLATQ